jgi:hypothetical protein
MKLFFSIAGAATIGEEEDDSAFHETADIRTSGNQGWSGLANPSRFAFYSPLKILLLDLELVKRGIFHSRGFHLCSVFETKSK